VPLQALPSNDQTPWVQALAILRNTLDRSAYSTWVENTVLLSSKNGTVTIGGMNALGVEWLREHVSINVAEALEKVLGRRVKVRFVVHDA
jgi:chromosomal replication initiation ATPase DnaA